VRKHASKLRPVELERTLPDENERNIASRNASHDSSS